MGFLPRIAISYRRADSQDITGRIFDRLALYYGRESVFRDIDNIRPGIDFREQISEALQRTDVLLVVVGSKWLGRAKGSATRIDDEADLVRIEVEIALKRRIPVIPILVGGMRMPATVQLPESLKDFAFRHASTIDGGQDFDVHVERLRRDIDKLLADKSSAPAPISQTLKQRQQADAKRRDAEEERRRTAEEERLGQETNAKRHTDEQDWRQQAELQAQTSPTSAPVSETNPEMPVGRKFWFELLLLSIIFVLGPILLASAIISFYSFFSR